ncbi:cupin domain-containing protein [Frigidibacter sp. SD6-1]|uniref:cupin domain-containing protein n=1 Tax=Frigidibacter sp. SD6-1 TaxID=3032581 RepID=UPI0024DF5B4D|nr:cupin domain-containing protein [Frigidibacter sp. SD6-1]
MPAQALVKETAPESANQNDAPAAGFVRNLADLPAEGGVDPVFGNVTWRTLISSDRTRSNDLVLGVAEFPPHGMLNLHRHEPPEFYFCLSGSGTVMIDGRAHVVAAGAAVYIPGNAEHGVQAGADGLAFAYGFAKDAFGDVSYQFSAPGNVLAFEAPGA